MVVEKTPLTDCGEVGASLSESRDRLPCPRRGSVPAISKQSATKRGLLSDINLRVRRENPGTEASSIGNHRVHPVQKSLVGTGAALSRYLSYISQNRIFLPARMEI
jgi:hypothetical protein